jgi:dethiobiotin synthetase
MARGVLITATEPAAGKTLIGCALAFAAHARGMRVGVMKPIAIGCGEVDGVLEAADVRGLAYAAASDLSMALISPYRYRSTMEVENAGPPDLLEIAEAYRKIASRSDFVIVEGFDAIATPIAWGAPHTPAKDTIDFARVLNLDVLIVARNGAGCLSAARLALEHAENRGIGVIGVILNDADQPSVPVAETNLESLRKLTGVPILGRVRFKQPVTREILEPLLSRL